MSMNDEIAPEIAALLENTEEIEPITSFSASAVVQQDDQDETDSASLKPTAPWAPVNLMIKQFQPVEQFFSDADTTEVFNDTSY